MVFFPQLSSITAPLRDLLRKDTTWIWDANHEKCVNSLKEILTKPPVLSFFDPLRNIRVSADASLDGLGAVLEQEESNGVWKPVQYASRRITDTEKRYSNVEREALGITWACEKFRDFLIGAKFLILTDSKPLVTLLGKKCLQDLTPRIQRFRMRLLPFTYEMSHVAGKNFYVPDALSRAPVGPVLSDSDVLEEEELEVFVREVSRPQVTDLRLKALVKAQQNDDFFRKVKEYLIMGWPNKLDFPYTQMSKVKEDLWVKDELLMYQDRVVIPKECRRDILDKLHDGHGGERKCLSRAKFSVWWPGITVDIKETVSKCRECIEQRLQKSEPMIATELPSRPWAMIGMDYFKHAGQWYLVVGDYYSRYIDINGMKNLRSSETINYLKSLFAKFGIPEVIRCDNGTNLVSYDVQEFAKKYAIEIVTSSPKFPQSNGFIESMVKIAKALVSKCSDINLGLLAQRTTPLDNGYSPAELLMGRVLRNTLPVIPERLVPKWPNLVEVAAKEKAAKLKMKENFDRRHGARLLRELKPGERVWVTDARKYGKVVEADRTGPRRYRVKTEDEGVLVRNRRHIIPTGT